MIDGKRVIVVLPAYNAEKTLEATVREIPCVVDEIILVDDQSGDATVEVANRLGLNVFRHPRNRGYGGNQKTCYAEALKRGADVVVMLHPDYQYSPRLVTAMASMVASGVYDVVLGSRLLGDGALRGGMPFYKFFFNRMLTVFQNVCLGAHLSEYHTGFRAFSSEVLRSLPLEANSEDFVFDNQVLAQCLLLRKNVGEISCPTRYFPEASSINFRRSVRYGMGVLLTTLQCMFAKYGLWYIGPFRFAAQNRLPGGPGSNRFSRFKTFLSLYFLVCVAFFALRTAHWKQVNDPAQLHYLCFLMDHGMAPYRDILEINMPGIYLVNWSVMHTLGGGSAAWRIFDLSLMGMAAWAMIAIAWPYDWLAGVFGSALFILYHGRDGAMQQGQRDLIIAVLLLCAYAFLFNFFRRHRKWAMLAFGLCAGMAATIKPTALPFGFLLLVLAAIRLKRVGEPVLRPSLYALVGLLAPFAIVGAFLISKHSLSSFWYLLHVGMPFYQSLGRIPFRTLTARIASPSIETLALIALTISVMKRDWWNWEGKLLVAGILFGIVSYLGQGKGFPYHRYPMLAFLFLWAGIQIITALRARRMVRVLAITGVGFAVILAPIYVNQSIHKVWDRKFSDLLAADLNHLGGAELSGHVQCLDVPADCDATLYGMRLVQSTGLFYDYLIFGSDQQQVIRDARGRFWQQFQSNTPRVIVVGSAQFPDGRGYGKLASWPLFQQELATQYFLYEDRTFPAGEFGPRAYRIYVQKGKLIASERH